jgi:hypothetical protein
MGLLGRHGPGDARDGCVSERDVMGTSWLVARSVRLSDFDSLGGSREKVVDVEEFVEEVKARRFAKYDMLGPRSEVDAFRTEYKPI